MAYVENSIADIIDAVDCKKIYLPAIQRKYVWTEDQITKLMDSIMCGYPFGTFLFWKVTKNSVNEKNYTMYEFIKDFHERDCFQNCKAGQPFNITPDNINETILSVLDGQQRLTSLYIALKGSLSLKVPKKHWNNNEAFPKKELYFDLHSLGPSDSYEIAYSFSFLTEAEANESKTNMWYRVKNILQYSDSKDIITRLVAQNGWNSDPLAMGNIVLLHQRLKIDKLINYFEVSSESIDSVLDIFVRVNSGGTVLSKTDLLFSTIVSFWDKGRDEIDTLLNEINRIGEHYNFTNDFIMRICLYVKDLDISLKVEAFNQDNVKQIKQSWNGIKLSIKDTVNLLNDLGFNSENIVAENAIIPVVYYRYKNNTELLKQSKEEIRKFLVIAQIKHIFGQSTSETLKKIRDELKDKDKKTDTFNFSWFNNLVFTGNRSLKYTEQDIENWFESFEKGPYTFMLLSLLYPNLKYGQKGFHQDHMHPASAFDKKRNMSTLKLPDGSFPSEEKIEVWKHQRNTLANLQLLEGRDNESKNNISLEEWLKKEGNRSNAKFLPEVDYSLSNFDEF